MKQIIYTCQKCGGDLMNLCIATYPPIPAKQCMKCGWYWEGKTNDIQRVPFDPEKEAQHGRVD